MRKHVFVAMAAVLGAGSAFAQGVPHNFKQDTPPVPGQIVETPRDALRLVPRLNRAPQTENVGLPLSGPMATRPVPEPRCSWSDSRADD